MLIISRRQILKDHCGGEGRMMVEKGRKRGGVGQKDDVEDKEMPTVRGEKLEEVEEKKRGEERNWIEGEERR